MPTKKWLTNTCVISVLALSVIGIVIYQSIPEIKDHHVASQNTGLYHETELLLRENKTDEAIALLAENSFGEQTETEWLIRLAYYQAENDPKAAFAYLDEALRKDPDNFDLRLHRAEFQEAQNNQLLALKEYEAAALLQPQNLAVQQKCADIYFNHQQFSKALEIWKSNLKPPTSDAVWFKVLFLSHLSFPVNFEWDSALPPPGRLRPLVKYLVKLQPEEFWNDEKFANVPEGENYLQTEQATYWLRLLETLRHNDSKGAIALLDNNPFAKSSWNPQLEHALKRIFAYQKTRSFEIPEEANLIVHSPDAPPFFQEIELQAALEKESKSKLKISENFRELLLSKEVFAAACLACGWKEAALALHSTTIYSDKFPEWVAIEMTQALKQNRGVLEAIQFAYVQPPSENLDVKIGELLIANGNPEVGLETLKSIGKHETENGARAAWLISLYYLERSEYDKAKEAIGLNSILTNELRGKEILARISSYQGDEVQAEKIYESIEKLSPEAKSYFARKAFSEGNWDLAAQYTQQLIALYPENTALKANLDKIQQSQDAEVSFSSN